MKLSLPGTVPVPINIGKTTTTTTTTTTKSQRPDPRFQSTPPLLPSLDSYDWGC